MNSHHNLFRIIISLFLLNWTLSFANISGNVIDSESKEVIIGARVSIKNTLLGDVTDRNGSFKINTDSEKNIVEINYSGYKKYSESVRNDTNFTIYLKRLNYKADELIVSANKKIESIQDVPISISIIKNEDFSTRNISSIDYALQYVPGVEVNQDNVSIRGSSGFSFGIGARTIFLQDGFPLLSADNNDIKFDIIPILLVDRVEVIKGAGSALYGTSALGGVINVITLNPTSKPLLRARVYSGIYDAPKYEQWNWSNTSLIDKGIDIAYAKKFGDYGIMGSVSGYSRDSYRRYDKSERLSMFLKQLYDFNEKTKIELIANYATSNTDDWVYWNSLDSALIPPTETDESIFIRANKLAISSQISHILNDYSLINFKVGIFNTFFSNMLDNTNSEFRESTGNTYFFESQYSNNLSDENSIIFGFESRVNQVSSFTYGDNVQSILGTYTQIENISFDNLILTLGLRADKELLDTLETNTQISPKFGLNYSPIEYFTFRGSYGRGFRTASLAERYATAQFQGFNVVENSNLKSETSQSVEIGFSLDLLNSENYLNIDISGFYNKYNDLIEPTFETSNATVIKFMNIIEAEISGVETAIRYNYKDDFSFNTSLTYMNPKNIIENKDLKYRSNILWYSSLSYQLLPFQIQFDYRFKSQYNEIDERLGFTIQDHDLKIDAHILDISLSAYSDIFDSKTKFTINLKNALNYYSLEMVGNMAPIRFLNFQIESEL